MPPRSRHPGDLRRSRPFGHAVANGGIYSLYRIESRPVPVHDVTMHLPPVSGTSKYPADNELYDRGYELVEAAAAIRGLADDPAGVRALPALLGCIEAALHELGRAVSSFDETVGRLMSTDAKADRVQRGFMTLSLTLADAELASTAARGLAASCRTVPSQGRAARDTSLARPEDSVPDSDDSSWRQRR